jgi:TrmH family RNA methyltransferase
MIDSPSNSIVRDLRALQTPKARKEQKRFLVEGVRLVRDALAAGWGPASLLYDPASLKRTKMGTELLYAISEPRLLDNYRGAIQEASDRAIAAASSTQHSQGVVASFHIREWELPGAGKDMPLVLICDDVQDPGNLGTILRAAEAAGVSAVLLTRDCVDLYNPKVVRAGMGAHFRLPAFPEQDWSQVKAISGKLGVDLQRLFATEAEAAQSYDEIDWRLASALIISNEAHGLSEDAREVAQGGLVSIPMLGDTESLNAAMAATVVLFEAARQRRNR